MYGGNYVGMFSFYFFLKKVNEKRQEVRYIKQPFSKREQKEIIKVHSLHTAYISSRPFKQEN